MASSKHAQPLPAKTKKSAKKTERPALFLLPDLMGSHLALNGARIWLDHDALQAGKTGELSLDQSGITTDGLVGGAYEALTDFLAKSHQVIPFPYDWRRSYAEAAAQLAAALEQTLAATDQPIRVVAHGTGGLVVQHLIRSHEALWQACMERKGGRLLLLGMPAGGTYRIPLLLSGQAPLFRQLTLLDPTATPEVLLPLLSRFPGLLELLPAAPDNFFDPGTWQALKQQFPGEWPLPAEAALQAAAHLHQSLLEQPFDPASTCYLAGKAPATPSRIDWQPADGTPAGFLASAAGDGRSLWESSIPAELADTTWYIPAEYGRLSCHEPAFPALLELITKGSTQFIEQQAPASGGARGSFVFQPFNPALFPDGQDLESVALGRENSSRLTSDAHQVNVYVTHGNLENARFPVAVGHHYGDGIVSAEGALDFYLNRRLSERHRAGIYPGEIETAEVVLQPDSHPPGGVVVGLGEFGELSTGQLERTFCHAVIALALKKQEYPELLKVSSGITPLLIGSNFGGLTLRGALRAMLTGTLLANERIRMMEDNSLKPIEEIEFIEIYEDRAIHAIRALDAILKEDRFRSFTLSRAYVRKAAGGRRQLLDEQEADWWHRFKVMGKDDRDQDNTGLYPLRFTSLTDRARAEESNLPTQRALVDEMIRQSVSNPIWDRTLSQAMFELLIPNPFKDYAADRNNILWIVDEASAEYPWELLQDPTHGEQDPVAVRAGMLRQLTVSQYRTQVRAATHMQALVVGDPISEFPALPAAQEEAELVSRLLEEERFTVEKVIHKKSVDIIKALFLHNYQILHLAGHGVVNFPPLGSTGMVLGENAFLSPEVINQMRVVPDFVFINCCHLGKVDEAASVLMQDRNQLAANLGTQLIRMGVRAVIAAGWAVDDAAAKTFATEFYRNFLNSVNFGESVRLARESTYHNHRHTQTWGAYQCYGDPYYTLRGVDKKRQTTEKRYYDPLEVLIDIENITSEADSASSRWFSVLKDRLKHITEQIPEAWMQHGNVLEALGNAFAALDLFPKAVAYYESALTIEQATYAVNVLERIANLKARWGAEMYLAADADDAAKKEAKELIEAAIDHLRYLLPLGKTAERLNLLGSACKRLALVNPTASHRISALGYATGYYEKARTLEASQRKDASPDLYADLNSMTLAAVLEWYDTGTPALSPEQDTYLKQEAHRLETDNRIDSSFWTLSFPANMYEIRLLYAGADKAEEYRPIILKHYETAWRYGGSYKKRDSVIQQFQFLTEVLQPPQSWPRNKSGKARTTADKEMRRLSAAFQEIMTELKTIMVG